MHQLFEFVVADEAHNLKDMESQQSKAIHWLKPSFYLLITATPCPNGVRDWSYNRFIETPIDLSVDTRVNDLLVNPYEDRFDDTAMVPARFTAQQEDDWIHNKDNNDIKRGEWLRKIWRECLIRRTNSSRIPFDNGIMVGQSIPKLSAVRVKFSTAGAASDEALWIKEVVSDIAQKPFVTPLQIDGHEAVEEARARSEGQEIVKVSMKAHRLLQMSAMAALPLLPLSQPPPPPSPLPPLPLPPPPAPSLLLPLLPPGLHVLL